MLATRFDAGRPSRSRAVRTDGNETSGLGPPADRRGHGRENSVTRDGGGGRRRTGYSVSTIRRMIDQGVLHRVRPAPGMNPRIPLDELRAFLARDQKQGTSVEHDELLCRASRGREVRR